MAAPSAWGAPAASAWATQVDEEEAANGGALDAPPEPKKFTPSAAAPLGGGAAAFPSLGEAATRTETKAERRAKQAKAAKTKMSLADFVAGGGAAGGGGGYRPPRGPPGGRPLGGGDPLAALPTAPRERREGDDGERGAFGGAFGDRDRPYERERRGFGDDGSDGDGFVDDGPSRADMSNNWGGEKKFVPSDRAGGGDRGDRGFSDRGDRGFTDRAPTSGGFAETYGPDRGAPRRDEGGGLAERYGPDRSIPADGGGPSRADTVNSWGEKKAFVPSSDGGGGAGVDAPRGPSAADVEDRWSKKVHPSSDGGCSAPGSVAGGDDGRGPAGRADGADVWRSSTSRGPTLTPGDAPPSAGGARPRLALKPRTLPLPADAAALDGASASADGGASANPFGAARPREAVLKDKGVDWRAEDAKLDAGRRNAARAPTSKDGGDAAAPPPRSDAGSEPPAAGDASNAAADGVSKLTVSSEGGAKTPVAAEAPAKERW